MRTKQELRDKMRQKRKRVSAKRRDLAARAVCDRLLVRRDVGAVLARKEPVAVYLAGPDEIDLTAFIEACLAKGVPVQAPRWNGATYEMAVLHGLGEADVCVGPHGILEPREPAVPQTPPARLWLVPGLAFTPKGARLGYGGGWYDRLLVSASNALKLGIGYRFQLVADLPSEPHDIALDGFVDEGISLDWEQAQGDRVMGIDEAGRGPLVGGVYAAAVSVPLAEAEKLRTGAWAEINDSKQLTEARREVLAEVIKSTPDCSWCIASASSKEIDEFNILRATHLAMRRAANECGVKLGEGPITILVDGLPVPNLPYPSRNVVKGDAKSLLIAAASILAKTARDADCLRLERLYPGYGFARHKGYPTAEHFAALSRLGPCPEHRKSFGPVAQAVFDFGEEGRG